MAKKSKSVLVPDDALKEIQAYADIHCGKVFGTAIVQLAMERLAGEGNDNQNTQLEKLINILNETNGKLDSQRSSIEKNSDLMRETQVRTTSLLSKLQILVDGLQSHFLYLDVFITKDVEGAGKRLADGLQRAFSKFNKNTK